MEFYIAHHICNLHIEYAQGLVTKISFCENLPEDIDNQEIPQEMEWATKELLEYLNGSRRQFTFPYDLQVTPFERRVYESMRNIPYGAVKTYLEVANEAQSPKGFRAVGQAAHKNPLPLLIPCHRVIGSNQGLTGFAGGLSVKEKLLKLEGYLIT